MDLERPSGWLRTAEGSQGQSSRLRTMKSELERYAVSRRLKEHWGGAGGLEVFLHKREWFKQTHTQLLAYRQPNAALLA